MPKIIEVPIEIKVYAKAPSSEHDLTPYYSLRNIKDHIAEAVEKAIKEHATVEDDYGRQEWELAGVNVNVTY